MSEAATTFSASPVGLTALLNEAENGRLQLPDFQRGWVWDEERIKSLISSISRGFPIGAIMRLQTGGVVEFKPRLIEGVDEAGAIHNPDTLLLDGQQRLTSLFQVLKRESVVETLTTRKRKVRRWFYLDINACLDPSIDRDDAIVVLPENKVKTDNFGRTVVLDVSTREKEYENLMVPTHELLGWTDWQNGYLLSVINGPDAAEKLQLLEDFKNKVVQKFQQYLLPTIDLGPTTSKEAVTVVFEKVNTGGKALDAFELITAMYAADGHELRRDWYGTGDVEGREERLKSYLKLPSANEGVLAGVGNTDFMQVVSLFHTRKAREEAAKRGAKGRELPQVSAKRQALLDIPLDSYLKYQDKAEEGFQRAAKFLLKEGVYRVRDIPYQSQVTGLAAVFAALGDAADSPDAAEKIRRWYWSGVFGELYGSSTETRMAKDFIEVPEWVAAGPVPGTVSEATIREDRLKSMRTRVSAAYKGVNALLMREGARDFRTGQAFSETVFFDENVDIHHIFPVDWCKKNSIPPSIYNSVINKTPLSAKTNRMLGGSAPSKYLAKLEEKDGPIIAEQLPEILESHLIDPHFLRQDDFEGFMEDRQKRLIALIEDVTGASVIPSGVTEETLNFSS